jgi:hypothetical protein
VTLNSVSMNMARVLGAALGGVIAAASGLALCFACNAVSFAAVLVSLAAMRAAGLCPAARVPRDRRQVRRGLRYVRRTPELFIPSITFNSLAKTTLQLAATPAMRGQVMALWALAWLGSTPVGGPVVGWAGQVAGPRWALAIGGLAALACGIAALPALTRIDRQAANRQAADQPAANESAANGRHPADQPPEAGRGHDPGPARPGDEQPVPVR